MTNELAVTGDKLDIQEYVNNDGAMLGFENFDQSQLKMPRYKLVQGTSKEGTPGKFRNNLTGEEYDVINGSLLGFVHKRVMWPVKYKRGDAYLCRSSDGIMSMDGKKCRTCDDSKWNGDEKPRCGAGLEFVGIDQNGDPFFIGAQGMSMSPANSWLTWANLKRKPLLYWRLGLHSKEDSNDQGKYFVLLIQNKKDDAGAYLVNDINQMDDAKGMYQSLMVLLKASNADLEDSTEHVAQVKTEEGQPF